MAWVLDHSETRGAARLALIAIANHADRKTGEAYPSQRTIAAEGRLSPGSIPAAVREAVRLGELEVLTEGGPRRQATYRMTFLSARRLSAERSDTEHNERSEIERSARPRERSAQRSMPSPAETSLTINEPSMNRADAEKARIERALAVGRPNPVSASVELHHPDDTERARVAETHLADIHRRLGR